MHSFKSSTARAKNNNNKIKINHSLVYSLKACLQISMQISSHFTAGFLAQDCNLQWYVWTTWDFSLISASSILDVFWGVLQICIIFQDIWNCTLGADRCDINALTHFEWARLNPALKSILRLAKERIESCKIAKKNSVKESTLCLWISVSDNLLIS